MAGFFVTATIVTTLLNKTMLLLQTFSYLCNFFIIILFLSCFSISSIDQTFHGMDLSVNFFSFFYHFQILLQAKTSLNLLIEFALCYHELCVKLAGLDERRTHFQVNHLATESTVQYGQVAL